ncbi:hypothetical protein [Xylanimonas ulmi]|uniref:Uncharacterized protein n=1 Tax=Xylanimonas ulmi TaxID=228973 RepID=A0A4Q7M1F7_9MICO|nr:hypothetical protein [Xylanibacterium ulmi]RZS61655.1 hypothetical protein EV386_1965 [Xylanibacterium ulmi]
MTRSTYVARHRGRVDTTDWKSETRERVAKQLAYGAVDNVTLAARGLHAAYDRYQPARAEARQPLADHKAAA